MVDNAINTNADIMIANFNYTKNNNLYKRNKNIVEGIINNNELVLSQNVANMFLINGRPLSSVCNKLYRRNFLEEINVKFEENIFAEDRLFNLKCYVNEPIISVMNIYTYNINIVENSRSRSFDNNFYQQNISLFHSLCNYLNNNDKYDNLLQYTLIFDINKILAFTFNNTKRKLTEIIMTISLLKDDVEVTKTVNRLVKQKSLKKFSGNRKRFIHLHFFGYLFINGSKFIISIYYFLYMSMNNLRQKM